MSKDNLNQKQIQIRITRTQKNILERKASKIGLDIYGYSRLVIKNCIKKNIILPNGRSEEKEIDTSNVSRSNVKISESEIFNISLSKKEIDELNRRVSDLEIGNRSAYIRLLILNVKVTVSIK